MTFEKRNNFREVRKQNSCGNCKLLESVGENGYHGWCCPINNMHFYPRKVRLPTYFICNKHKKRKEGNRFRFYYSDISFETNSEGAMKII